MSIYTEKFSHDYWDNEVSMIGGKKADKIRKDPTKHYPNRDEAKVLRNIMASTGLSEEEVRADKTHRKTLANAQKQGQKAKRDATVKWYQDRIKEACKKTGLVPQHPDTIKALDEILDKRYSQRYYLGWYTHEKPKAKTVVKQYAK